jgi:hypothetical protein
MAIGAFISISVATRGLEVAALANRLSNHGWRLITAVMVLFSVLGTSMGFSVETLGFYALFVPLMAALAQTARDRRSTSPYRSFECGLPCREINLAEEESSP